MTFNIALTADFYDENGKARYAAFGLSVFDDHSSVAVSPFNTHLPEIGAEQLSGVNGVLVLTPRVTNDSLAQSDDLLIISRFGVGYDSVDVEACTDQDVMVTITRGAVDRPVAEATIAWMLALNHNVLQKDRLVRTGDWDGRSALMGSELRDKTLGVVGLGGIGQQLVTLVSGFGMSQPIAYDPFASDETFRELGVQRVSLEQLLSQSDFVSLHCPLTEDTTNLIGSDELSQMKSSAYLLNLARGGVVDEDALYEALLERRIAGAALDCFEEEPVTSPHRFGQLDNVILAPHSIAWTDELFRDIGEMGCRSLLDVSRGKVPHGLVNPAVLEKSSFQSKWQRLLKTLDA